MSIKTEKTIVPNLDDFIKKESPDGGCAECCFQHMEIDGKRIRCSEVPCNRAHAHPVIYTPKPKRKK